MHQLKIAEKYKTAVEVYKNTVHIALKIIALLQLQMYQKSSSHSVNTFLSGIHNFYIYEWFPTNTCVEKNGTRRYPPYNMAIA